MTQTKHNIIWAPQQGAQITALTCPLFEMMMEGDRGGGKTDTFLMDFAQHVGQGYGEAWRGILFRRTYKELGDIIAKSKKWFWKIWPQAKFNSSDSTWKWPEGETLYLRQFLRDDDYWNYHGHEYPWVGWEELCTNHSLSGYKQMKSCCRSSHPDIPRKYRSTTNPYGPGHNQVKFHFQLPAMRNKIIYGKDDQGEAEEPRIALLVPYKENLLLQAAEPNYLKRIRAAAKNEAQYKAWTESSWDIVAGGMFDDIWQGKIHVVKPFRVPTSWKIDRSFDWGSSAPFSVGWWAQSDGSDVQLADGRTQSTVRGDLFRINEWYGWNGKPNEGLKMLATDIAKGIIEREINMGYRSSPDDCQVKAGPADSQIYNEENGVCIGNDMKVRQRVNGKMYKGVHFVAADKSPHSRVPGWEQMRQRMKNALPNEDHTPRENPGLFVFSNCDQFIRTVPVLPRDEKKMDDIFSDGEDHIGDEARYKVRQVMIKTGSGKTTGHY
jgi:hypothetical protein